MSDYAITDTEALPILKDACRTELLTGIGNLPTKHFRNHFQMNLSQLDQQPIENLKQWLHRFVKEEVLWIQ